MTADQTSDHGPGTPTTLHRRHARDARPLGPVARRWSPRSAAGIVLLAGITAAQEPTLPAPWQRCDPPDTAEARWPDLRGDATGAWITWLQPQPEQRRHWRLRLCRFHGETFTAPRDLRLGRDFLVNWADFAAPCATASGDLYVHFLRRATGPGSYDAVLLRSAEPAAAPFAELGTPYGEAGAGGEHGFVSMLPEGEDAVRLFWLDGRRYQRDQRMELRTALARGDAFADERVLDPDVCSCCQTGAALANGAPLLVYRGRDPGEVRDIKLVRRTPEGWSKPATVATDGWVMPGCPVNGPAVAADGDRVAVAWFTAAAGKARVRLCFSTDGGASFAPPLEVDGNAPTGRVDVAITDRGALVCWLAKGQQAAEVVCQEWSADGKAGPRATLAALSAGRDSGFPRLERAGPMALLLWTDPQNGVRGARVVLAELEEPR